MSYSFIISQKDLLTTLFFMQPICTKKTTISSTSCILFQISNKELILKATDLEISLQYSCQLTSSSSEFAQFLVPGKKIFDIVKEMEGDIECVFDETQITLKSQQHINVSFNIKNAEEFPKLPERIENLMQMDAQFLSNMLGKVSFLIPQNNATPSLNGLFLEISAKELKLTSTDGHCLAQVTSDRYVLEKEKKWLLPRRAIFELKKILENSAATSIFLGTCDNQLVFSGDHFNFFTRLLADEFPKYESILQHDAFIPATVNKTDFVKTLRRSSCLLSGQFLATNFTFNKDQLKVSMKNTEVGNLEETLAIGNFDADKLEMRFYSPYLLQGLQSFEADQLTCFLKNNTRPIIFKAEGDMYHLMYLVMPVSTNNI
ncbi:DNA polymerase III subunit beta [candidate division TM6 bacterium RIFCSPHIGHO2_12_FULL_38_8]|nr:MAG: DNA polymerase III subunit beta [candidate division TM6 bacterium RIFCSPHIGHO2_12_FULL_38_8]